MKLHHLFLNRWMAVLWSAIVVVIALDIAGPGETGAGENRQAVVTDVTGAEVSNAQVEQVESIIANL